MLGKALLTPLALAACALLTNGLETFDVNLDTAVHLHPPSAWNTTNATCDGAIDHFTTQSNATASFSFTGDRLQISTVGSESAGIIAMVLDSQNHGSHTVTYDLFTDTIDCGLQVDHFLDQDTYNVTLILAGPSAFVNSTNSSLPEFHVLDITYYVTNTSEATGTISSPPVDSTSSVADGNTTTGSTPVPVSSERHAGPIIGGVIGGIILLLLILLLLVVARRRRASRRIYRTDWVLGIGRHSFNPTRPMNAVYMSELSPRTAARNADMTFDFDSAKLLPYTMLDDDHEDMPAVNNVNPFSIDEDDVKDGENPFELAIPVSAYTSSKSGSLNVKTEIRSRSPAPKDGNGKA